jgi:uncharacterized protein DUF1552
MSNRIDRRRFLFGAGGAILAIPMLQTFAPRTSHAGGVTPPKRLILVTHGNGRVVANGKEGDWWSPGSQSGPLPLGAPSQMLAPLAAIRDEIVTIDGIDGIVRHATGDADGHLSAEMTALTCQVQQSQNQAGGESIDYVAGMRLRANEGMKPSIIIPASATPEGFFYSCEKYWGAGGTDAYTVSGNPQTAVNEIFGPPMPPSNEPPPEPTLKDRLVGRRKSALDAVAKSITALRPRLNARDKEQLDRHADFIHALQQSLVGGGGGAIAHSCTRPDETLMPDVMPSDYDEFVQNGGTNPFWEQGRQDAQTTPWQIENLVQALACDVTRVACLNFWVDAPEFPSEFSGTSPFEGTPWHDTVHATPRLETSAELANAQNLRTGFQFVAKMFTLLVQRLADMQDTDDSRLLDNTLVVWISELGYGSEHATWNLPVVMAGLGGAFQKGRHIVEDRRTTGDLHAHILRLLGGSDTTFGATGTLGALAAQYGSNDLFTDAGAPGYITASTPLHRGALSL